MGSLARPGPPHIFKYKVQDVIASDHNPENIEGQYLPLLITRLVSTWLIEKVRMGNSLPIMARPWVEE